MQLSLSDPDYVFDPFSRPMPLAAGTRVRIAGERSVGRVVQGMVMVDEDSWRPFTARGTVSVRRRVGGQLYTAQVPLSRVEVLKW